jgi:LEA14-like dessication related protein
MQLCTWHLLPLLMAYDIIIPGCSAFLKRPEVSVKGVSLSSVSLSALSLEATFLVNNPNPFGITLRSLSFDMYYQNRNDWVYLSHGERTGIQIERGEIEVNIPITVRNTELIRSLTGFIFSGKIMLQINGIAFPDLFVIAPEVPFTYMTTISL